MTKSVGLLKVEESQLLYSLNFKNKSSEPVLRK